MSALNADASTLSPSWMSIARRILLIATAGYTFWISLAAQPVLNLALLED